MRWEYLVVSVLYGEVKTSKGKERESEFLNRVGTDGWELVAATGQPAWEEGEFST